jgi:hypothetical protein
MGKFPHSLQGMRPIPGFPGYLATAAGQIIGKRHHLPMRASLDADGYLQLTLRLDGKTVCRRVHQLIALAFLPPAGPGDTVDHIDRDKSNNRASNLRWMQRAANSRQAHAHQRLSTKAVADIMRRAAAGERYRTIAADYNRGEATIWKIAHRHRYLDLNAKPAAYRWSAR